MVQESNQRSVTKAISWRITATFTTMLIVLAFTGELTLAFEIGFIEVIAKMILYFFHERAWLQVNWGRVYIGNDQ